MKMLKIVLASMATFVASAATAATVTTTDTVSGVFAPDPILSGVLLAEASAQLAAGDTRFFETSLFPVAAEFSFRAGTLSDPATSNAFTVFLQPGETGSFTETNTTADPLLYSIAVRVGVSDVAALSFEEQQQFFGQPVSLFDFTNSSPNNGGGTGAGDGSGDATMPPVPVPISGLLLFSGLLGLVAVRRRKMTAA